MQEASIIIALALVFGGLPSQREMPRVVQLPSSGCETPAGTVVWPRAYSQRAVEIMAAATDPTHRQDARIGALLAPDARFGLANEDVVIGLPRGIEGIRELVTQMHADRYRFDGMDSLFEPCHRIKVTVEFIDSDAHRRSEVAFDFEKGVLVSAFGRRYSFSTGPFPAAPDASRDRPRP